MCFHWKSLLRQVRISGDISSISNNEADEYFNSRSYLSRIGAWSSNQSKPMETRDAFLNKIEEYKNKFKDENNVPRPKHWSGFLLAPNKIEFWKDVEGRLHQRLEYQGFYIVLVQLLVVVFVLQRVFALVHLLVYYNLYQNYL